MQQRMAFVNVWLPISEAPIMQEPLAVCDWQSRLSDLTDWSGAEVEQRSSHRWYFFSGMTAGEALVMKQWDSLAIDHASDARREGPAREALHTAFKLPTNLIDTPARESCEVRVLVLFGDALSAVAASEFRSKWCQPHAPEYNIFV